MLKTYRAGIFHTPVNAFDFQNALVAIEDGGLVVSQGKILACDDYATVRRRFPGGEVEDLRGGFLLPGFIDTHIHFPQVRVIGGLGHSLLDWLDQLTLPEEGRLANLDYAATIAAEFVQLLVSHGTTTALVFGSHFARATSALFEASQNAGLRVISGLVLADRLLRPELHKSPDAAWQQSRALIERFHCKGRLAYAVTPRFALSATESMLEVCQALVQVDASLLFTSHLNENPREIEEVRQLFPWSSDYLSVYERFELVGRRSVFAHNVHATDSELTRLSEQRTSISHCPCSNAALGSGIFPMLRHLDKRVHFALGTDVGGGIGFGIPKEALQGHLMQRVAPQSLSLTSAQMLYLATRAGAEALSMEEQVGDFEPGKSADFVYLRAPETSALAAALRGAEAPRRRLDALLTMAGAESVCEVRVDGELVWQLTS